MKYAVLALVLLVAWFVWRSRRRSDDPPADARRPPQAPGQALQAPQDMVRCPVCAVHLPRPDAVPGAGGRLYCSAEHAHGARERP